MERPLCPGRNWRVGEAGENVETFRIADGRWRTNGGVGRENEEVSAGENRALQGDLWPAINNRRGEGPEVVFFLVNGGSFSRAGGMGVYSAGEAVC